MTLNQAQLIALASYAGSDFAHLKTKKEIDQCGDTLFKFLMSELADIEDCLTLDDAYYRVGVAIADLETVRSAIAAAMTATGS